jgi:hypothetical protein
MHKFGFCPYSLMPAPIISDRFVADVAEILINYSLKFFSFDI